MPNGSDTYENSHSCSNTLCASTCTVPAQYPDSQHVNCHLLSKLCLPTCQRQHKMLTDLHSWVWYEIDST